MIAISAPIAKFVKRLPQRIGKKFYFIQGYEDWWYPNITELESTYKLGLNNIVISNFLREKVKFICDKQPYYVPNFYDDTEFYLSNTVNKRANVVSLLDHKLASKRTDFGLKVLEAVKKEIPDLQVELFGNYKSQKVLPDYVHFTYSANYTELREDIYGKSKVYLMPSISEGWGLTGTEAMACGAVLVTSYNSGVTEYASSVNSIVINSSDLDDYVSSIIEILNNDNLRIQLATRGIETVKKFSMEHSTSRLIQALFSDE